MILPHFKKYPRTPHLPFSLGRTSDDRVLSSTKHFNGKPIIVTEKMDGENTTLYREYFHARSLDGRHHPSRDWVKNFWGGIKENIPYMWRVCGENLFAKHSILYTSLKSYFLGFSIWNEKNICLNWKSTQEWFALLDIETVPVLFNGIFNEEFVKNIWSSEVSNRSEGYVIRLADEFHFDEFGLSVAKFVRPNHVQSSDHWTKQKIERNLLG